MKVDVITVAEATFKSRWRWWSNWIDVAMFDYKYETFLIQMRVSRTNAKAFRSVCVTGDFFYRQVTTTTVGDLTQMKGNA